ncbi:MAG: NAD(P)-dependent oxidoreductase [Candidatus Sungbacteria bacterium]|nr:NAD(P)-dependent oxidoreductase [Candidatus Sungbacteria bacterium]
MRYLVTGGSGFIGSNLVLNILNNGFEVTILDFENFPKSPVPSAIKFIKGDVRSIEDVRRALIGIDIVIHAAAALPLQKDEDIHSVNADGTRILLEESYKKGIKTFVFLSSIYAYGIPQRVPLTEDHPLISRDAYSGSKKIAEQYCEIYRKKDMKIPILRLPTVIGAERLGAFQILFEWIMAGRRVPIIGSGTNRHQFLSVDDAIRAILFVAASSDIRVNDTFNIGAKEFGTIRGDLEALCSFANSGSKIFPLPAFPVKVALRFFDKVGLSPLHHWIYETADIDFFGSIDKIEKLGWSPQKSNKEILIDAFQWYREHKDTLRMSSGKGNRSLWNQGVLGIVKKFF